MKKLHLLVLLLIMTAFSVVAQPGLEDILAPYDSETLSDTQIQEINQVIRSAGYRGGPELDALIRAEGFDPELFKGEPPTPTEEIGKGPQNTSRGSEHERQNNGTVYSSLSAEYNLPHFIISSPAVVDGELQSDFKCEKKVDDCENSLPLKWESPPHGTGSLAILMYHYPNPEDKGSVNSYLLLWNISPDHFEIPYGAADDGPWYIGQNKDGTALSYTSPCSPSAGVHEYVISLFALKNSPKNLPDESSMEVDFDTFMTALEETEILGRTDLVFLDVND